MGALPQGEGIGDVVASQDEGLTGVQPDPDDERSIGEMVVVGADQLRPVGADELFDAVFDIVMVAGKTR